MNEHKKPNRKAKHQCSITKTCFFLTKNTTGTERKMLTVKEATSRKGSSERLTHERWQSCYEGKSSERLTVCTLKRQSSGKLTHTAAGWEHSECWQTKIKGRKEIGAMSNTRWHRKEKEKLNCQWWKCVKIKANKLLLKQSMKTAPNRLESWRLKWSSLWQRNAHKTI